MSFPSFILAAANRGLPFLLSLGLGVVFLAAERAAAQQSLEPQENGNRTTLLKPISNTKTSKSRKQLWNELNREAAALKQQSRVLKTLIKLVRPSIAHLEAEKSTASPTGSRKVEETGAGVVFAIDHVITF